MGVKPEEEKPQAQAEIHPAAGQTIEGEVRKETSSKS
jgi:hypothetical protein